MRILIVDDEERARSLLRGIIQGDELKKEFHLFEAANLTEAVNSIKEEQPDLVFMDIEMPGKKGTEIFQQLEGVQISFHLVFTTAYQEFALKAFEMNAFDYLLKPLRPQKVKQLIQNVKEEKKRQSIEEQLKLLHSSLMTKSFKKIGLPLSDGVEFVPIEDIVQMEADGMYTTVFLKTKEKRVISKPLKHFVELLSNNQAFLKPHRSHLINMRHLKQFSHKDGGYLIMDNQNIVPIARNRKQAVLESLS
ncbi:MAG: LytTR family DNA-binding domain-containing protein [Vicingaceae bacterium]